MIPATMMEKQEQRGKEKEVRNRFVAYLLSLGGYEWDAKTISWVWHQERIKRGALADLRTGLLVKELGKMTRVHKYVQGYLPEKGFDERWYYIIATLFGSFPQHREEWRDLPSGKRMRVRTLGKAFKPLAFPPGEKKKESMEARFVALLNAHSDDLDDHLRHAVSLLKANEQPLDWFRLLEDLLQWNHPEGHVQLKWARDFYKINNSRGDDTSQSSTTSENKGEKYHE